MDAQKMSNASERTTILNEKLAAAHKVAEPGTRWLHKKGGEYGVAGFTIDSTSGDVLVLYGRIGGPDFDAQAEYGIYFSRPIAEWTLDRFTPMT